MNTFEELMGRFNLAKASNNEKLLYNAVCALITIVENQQKEIEVLETNRETFYG